MAVNKNFVVKNGLEVNTQLILADATTNKVGIGSTAPRFELDVAGGIGATDSYVIGISTVLETFNVGSGGKVLSVIAGSGGISTSKVGIGTSNPEYLLEVRSPVSTGQTAVYIYGDLRVTGDLSIDDITLDDAQIQNLTVTEALNVTSPGISTFGGYVDINSNVDVSGAVNIGGITTITNTTDSTTFNNGALVIDGGLGVEKNVNIGGNLDVTGNISVAGSFFSLQSQEVYISNKDIILGFTTTVTPNDDTANHAGVAIASTEGYPLVSFSVSGINTLPDTYKQIMWFRSGTLGFSTDIFGLNYGLAIGTTSVVDGTRLAVGSDIRITDTTINTINLNVNGIVTSTSGVTTYYGDGQYLDLKNSPYAGIGIGTTGGLVGYGITFLDLKGAGVSTTQYESSVGIATIFFEGGGGGGGSISISTVAPTSPGSGDLWYSPDYGRTFIYYDETVVGYGTDAYWVDAAPFNAGINATLAGVAFSAGLSVSPSLYFAGDIQTGFFSPTPGQFTIVSTGSSVLNVNADGVNVTGVVTATSFVGNLTGNADTATTAINAIYSTTAGVSTYSTTAGVSTYSTTAGVSTYSETSGISTYSSTTGVATAILGGNAGVNTTSTPTNLYVSGNAASNIVGLGTTDANTTLDFGVGNNFSLALTGSIVLSNPIGVTTGQSGIILIQQDGVGSHTVGFGSYWDFPSATAPTLSTGANALDALTYFVRSSTSIITNSLIGIGTL